MEDNKIVDLYWERSENAIAETDKKYRITVTILLFTFYTIKKIAMSV